MYCGKEEGGAFGGVGRSSARGGGVLRFTRGIDGRIVSGMKKCINKIIPFSLIK